MSLTNNQKPREMSNERTEPFIRLFREIRGRFAESDELFYATVSEPLKTIMSGCQEAIKEMERGEQEAYNSPGHMVMLTKGERPPKFIHASVDLAMCEAERLAVMHASNAFILKIVGHVEVQEYTEVRWFIKEKRAEGLADIDEDDLPF